MTGRRYSALFAGGSMNQTTQMHQIARALPNDLFEKQQSALPRDG